jgi:mannosyltransferase
MTIRRPPLSLIELGAPTALAAGLVLFDLGARSLWVDEGDTFTTASQHGSRLWDAALNDGGNMFTYYLGMHFWTVVFGSSEFWLRLPTALAAVATVPVCFYLMTRLFDRRAAVFGSVLVAASLPFVWWAQNARAYLVAVFLVCGSTLALVVAVQTRRRLAWVLYAVLSALAVYTILLSALVLLAQAVSLLARRGRDLSWKALVGAGAAVGLMLVPLLVVVASHGTRSVQWETRPGPLFGVGDRYLLDFLASSRTDGVPFSAPVVDLLTAATILCWVLGVGLFLRRVVRRDASEEAWGLGLLLSWFVVPPVAIYLISVSFQPILTDRYLLPALPPASMLAGVVLSRLRPRLVAVAAVAAVLVLRVWVILPGYGVSLENWRQGVIDVTARSQPDDCIAFFTADGYTAFDYYVTHLRSRPGPVPMLVLPETTWAAHRVYALDPESIPVAHMPEVVASCPRLWLVLSHDRGNPPGPGVLAYQVRVYETQEALTSELDASYRQSSTLAFTGANVVLYVRR